MTLAGDEEKVLDHVGYEWWMLRCTYDRFKAWSPAPKDDDPVRNALVESLVIHGRNLIDFFYVKPSGDDLHCEQVRTKRRSLPESGPLCEWKARANKYLAHLTAVRFVQPTDWPSKEVRAELEACFADLEVQMAGDLPSDWIGKRAVPQTMTVPPGLTLITIGAAQ